MELVAAGRYDAKVVEHAITETSQGLPQAAVKLGFETEDGYRELIWFGSFKEKALPHTIKALLACGLQGNNPADPLTIGQEVSIVVEVDQDQDGNDRNVVRWINIPGAGGFSKPIESMTAKAKLEQFSGAVLAAKESLGLRPKNSAPQGKKDKHPYAPGSGEPWD